MHEMTELLSSERMIFAFIRNICVVSQGAVAALLLFFCLGFCSLACAQTAAFFGERITLDGGFSSPEGVAVDVSGNVYIADTNGNAVKEVPVGCTGLSCVMTLGSGFRGPKSVGVDKGGNVYVADTGNSAVKVMVGCASSSCAVTTLGSGFNAPTGVAVDLTGHIYIADTGNGAVKEMPAGCGSPSCVVTTLYGGFSSPTGMAVDRNNNIYVTDASKNTLTEIMAGCTASSCIVRQLASGFSAPMGVSVDGSGNVYVADSGNGMIKEIPVVCASSPCTVTILGSGFKAPVGVAIDASGTLYITDTNENVVDKVINSNVNLGSFKVGSASATYSLLFTFQTPGTLGGIRVVTQGNSNLDFADAKTGDTCSSSHGQYNIGDTCTVNVIFTPLYPGPRYGAVQLTDNSINKVVMATAYISGTGTGALVNFLPGRSIPRRSGFNAPSGVAVDAAGNIYVANAGTGEVLEMSVGCTSYKCATRLGGGYNWYVSVAVDGAGNVYTGSGDSFLRKIPSGCADPLCVIELGITFYGLRGVAVDGAGNIYVATTYLSRVQEIPAGCSNSSCVMTLGRFSNGPENVAVDGNGNVYVTEAESNSVTEMTPNCKSSSCMRTLGGGFSRPAGVTVDGSGNIYIADQLNGALKKMSAGCADSSCVTTLASDINQPSSVAVDGKGNVYFAGVVDGTVDELDYTNPSSLIFATQTYAGTVDFGALSVTVENVGNAALTYALSESTTPANFIQTAGSGNPTDCAAGGSLAPGVSCNLSIKFAPKYVGAFSESFVLTDNSANSATQSIALNGTSIAPAVDATQTTVTISPNPLFAGQSATLTATVIDTSIPGRKPSGSVSFTDMVGGVATTLVGSQVTLSSGVATLAGVTLFGGGTHSVTATYGGETTPTSSGTLGFLPSTSIANPNSKVWVGSFSPVGIAASSLPVELTFATAGTLGNINVLTQGVLPQSGATMDFTKAGEGNCQAGKTYTLNSTCTVNVLFNPQYPGSRYGAVQLTDQNTSAVLATAYISGTGTGPQINFLNGVPSLLGDGNWSRPYGVAVDGAGNVFVVDNNSETVTEIPANCTSSCVAAQLGGNFVDPRDVALDGAGNVYVLDQLPDFSWGVKEMPANCTSAACIPTVLVSGFNYLTGLAVDGSGNVYVVDNDTNLVTEIPFGCASSSCPTMQLGGDFTSPYSVAVDGGGNVYIADMTSDNSAWALKEIPAGCAASECVTTLVSGINAPFMAPSLAVDGKGNVYFSDWDTNILGYRVAEFSAGCTALSCAVILPNFSLEWPTGIAVDGKGNIYVADYNNGAIYELDSADARGLSFTTPTVVGNLDNDIADSPQSVTVKNVGNAPLTFTALTAPSGFLRTAGTGTPPDCAVNGTLATGASCNLNIIFKPNTVGNPLSQKFVLTDNSLNVTSASQYIGLNGIGIGTASAITITLSRLNPGQVGIPYPNVSFLATGGTGPYTYSYEGTLPKGMSLSNGVLSGTPVVAGNSNSFTVTATDSNSNSSSQSYTMVINTGLGMVTLGNLTQTYTGSALAATATTVPTGKAVTFTYTGISPTVYAASSAAPTNAGSYTVVGALNDENYTGTSSGTLVISRATTRVTLTCKEVFYDGTPHSCTGSAIGLSGAEVNGTWTESPASETSAGSYPSIGTFTSSDLNYSNGTASGKLKIDQATPPIAWTSPPAVTYGTTLSSIQLDATASVQGTFVYSPVSGTTPSIGNDTLSVVFSPTDTKDYTTAKASVVLVVTPPSISVPVIASISPAYTSAGGPVFTLTINGSGFVSGSVVYWGATKLSTQLVSATQLTAQVTAADIASAGITSITVQSLPQSAGTSNTLQFEIDSGQGEQPPVFTPTTIAVAAGSRATYQVILPASATNISATCLNLPIGANCSYSSSTTGVTITTSAATPAGTYLVTVIFTETFSGVATSGVLLPILLPLLAFSRRKRAMQGSWYMTGFWLILAAVMAFSIGCGGEVSYHQSTNHQVTSSGVVTLKVN